MVLLPVRGGDGTNECVGIKLSAFEAQPCVARVTIALQHA